nr:non-ribosomal peptide synthetase [Actinomadura rayongensis]
MSPLQEGLLFHVLYDEDAIDFYAGQGVFDLDGPLDAAALRASAEALLDRHDNLRAGFQRRRSGDAVQLVPRRVVLPWREADLSHLDGAAALAEAERLAVAEQERRFDPAVPPLLRCLLIRFGDDRHRLVMTIHHILVDGWSLPILFRELFAVNAAGGRVEDAGLPPVPDYRHYLAWLAEQDREEARTAWRNELAGLDEPTLVAPADPNREPVYPGRIAVQTTEDLTAALRTFARERGITLNTVLQAAWAMVVGQMAGRRDVVFGAVVAGRPPELPGAEDMLGLFINTIPVRVELDPEQSAGALLAGLQARQSALLGCHYLGLAEIQRLAGPGAGFDTLVAWENFPQGPGGGRGGETQGLKVTPAVGGRDATHYPLSLAVNPLGDRLGLRLTHRPDLFAEPAAHAMLARLVGVLERIVADPDAPVGRIGVVDARERELLSSWNATAVPARCATLVEGFAAQVERSPGAVAVAGDVSWTYAELDAAASRIASGLAGVRRVGVVLERSASLVAALVGTVKAGAAYVPVDPGWPAARIQRVLSEAGADVVVTESGLASLIPDGLAWVTVDALMSSAPGTDAPVDPDDLAYVMYTSGSTGVPKGVAATHRGVSGLALDSAWGVGPGSRVLLHAPVAFDASTYEIWVPLLSGGQIVVAPPGPVDAGVLRGLIAEFGLTAVHATAGLLGALAQEAPDCFAGLDEVLTGGDVVSPGAVAAVMAACPGVAVRHLYGPTEVTLCATTHRFAAGVEVPSVLPIGRPRDNTRAFVLDGFLRPAPIGVAGELYVAGSGLAQGYLDRAALSAERFVACPYGEGERMYRTGDLVRWDADGQLVFVGRADTQVKIRGFRIEPAEIETVLARHEQVARAAVIAWEDQPGDKRLVAYVVPANGAVDTAALRTFTGTVLPDYMIPAAVVTVPEFPLTRSGKLDRAALPAPDFAGAVGARAPRTATEEILCGLFGEILGLERVGADDDFFDLGGDSLLAMRLIARVRAVLDVDVPVRAIFGAPTPAGMAALVAAHRSGGTRAALAAVERPDVVPLSFGQARMWFLNRLEDTGAVYNMPWAMRLSGELDRAALQAALDDVADRHESLRTVYPANDGVPVQRIRAGAHPELAVTPVTEDGLGEALTAAAGRGFDVARELPWRAHLFVLGPDEYVLMLVVHHIASDGWSMGVLARDVSTAYAARHAGRAPDWAPLPVQYADFALWQRAVLGTEDDPDSVISGQLAYWRDALAELPPELTLPTDRPRPAVASHRGGSVPIRVSAETHARLVEVARAGQATVFMVAQAALAVLLSRLGAGEDIPIGTPVAGRSDAALDDLVGFFLNTLVLRTDLTGDPAFTDVLRRVRETDLAAYSHQDVPFERLVEDLSPVRSLARHPLFQVMLVFQNAPTDGGHWELSGMSTGPVRSGGGEPAAKFDLSFTLQERRTEDGGPAGIGGTIGYATDLFDRATAETLAARLTRVLDQVAADPRRRLSRVDVMNDREAALLDGWNATAATVPDASPVDLFEARVARDANAVAVVDGDAEWSYGDLNAQVNRLAWYLAERGVGAETRVGVLVERSVWSVVSMLAVLKAGGVYVPLDAEWPSGRVTFVLEDCSPAVVLCSSETASMVGDDVPTVVVDGPELARDLAERPAENPRTRVWADSAAYLIYTSGSTGRPKGVVVHQAGIVNRLLWMQDQFGLTAEDRVLHKTSVGFDVSMWELLWPLITGAGLVLARPGGHRDPAYLAELIRDARVTTAHFVPSMLRVFVDEPSVADCAGLRRVICSGEALPPDLVEQFYSRLDVPLFNLYGPTEASVDVTWWECPQTSLDVVPIGRPVWNTEIFVLDGFLRPVPPGVPGEVYLQGVQLARGYLGRPGLSAERFVASPFAAGERMYRTGDIGRWTTDGQLVYLGRADDQVKIRGFRIEPGEIEAAILTHDDVAQAAVVVREDRPGDVRLVAYVIPARPADPAAIRAHAASVLPEYMVPAAVVPVEEWPLSASGKLDRAALPAPDFAGAAGGREPRTITEEIVCGLFADVLTLERAGAEDNFFSLGGDSLLAMRLIARVRAALDVEVPIRTLFANPTPAGIAAFVADRRSGGRPALTVAERPEQVPLSFGQARMWFLNRLEEKNAAYNMPWSMHLTGDLDQAALHAALADLADRHETLRTIFPDVDGVPVQHVLDGPDGHPELVVASVAEPDLRGAMAEVARRKFDVGRELPWRTHLFILGENEYVLSLVVHHIAGDGWSMGVLARDLSTAYTARRNGHAPDWAPLPVQYADFALWQRNVLGTEDDPDSPISAQLTHWRRTLAELPPELNLPVDRPRPATPTLRGGRAKVRVPADVHARLAEVARDGRATVFMAMQAAVAVLLSRLGAGEDIPIGTATAGRSDAALDDLIGFFLNTLVLRTDLTGDPTFAEALARVRDTDLAAYSHQDVPFERLVDDLSPARSNARHPLFQVSLEFQNAKREGGWNLPGLSARPVRAGGTGAVRFDLAFRLRELRSDDGAPTGIEGDLEFAADLFDETTAQALADRLVRVLDQVTEDPDRRLGAVDVLDADERRQVLEDWNATTAEVRRRTFTDLFAERVAAAPDAVALLDDHATWTYAELNTAANRLARHLIARGAGPERTVALMVPRSAQMVVAVLAVLKAGAAYLPVDPQYPAARVGFMLGDARPALLLCTVKTAALADDGTPRIVLDAPDVVADLADRPGTDPGDAERILPLRAHHPAYVIYTSGSTGTPKGVVVSHTGIESLALSQRNALGLDADSRVLQFASLSFDAAVWEIVMALLSGAGLVVAGTDRLALQEALPALTAEHGVTHATLPPAVVAALPDGALDGVATLVLAGEQCTPELVRRWSSGRRMINAYGPTEGTICSTMTDPLTGETAGEVPIGRPLANARAYVLDGFLQPVPAGVAGELYVTGEALARGYLGRVALTAERFVACPYGTPGERMYRTGDLVRRRPDGQLVFLGRADGQVKLRGFRIEPAEIESVLAGHPAVAQATVIVWAGPDDDRRLVAYAVPAEGAAPDGRELREHVAATLPDHMVPAVVAVLDALPLTPSGKVDRAALPDPDFTGPGATRDPRTAVEEILCGLFAEILGVARVGAEDDFFALGGDSLMGVRLITRIRAVLDVEVGIRALFGTPTPAGVAAFVERDRTGADRAALVPADRPAAIPLSFGQARMWFLNRFEGAGAVYNMPWAVRLSGDLDRTALAAALGDVADRHESLRTMFPDVDGVPVQEIVHGAAGRPRLITAPVAEADLGRTLDAAMGRGFDVARELPWRAHLFTLGPDDHVLLLVLHHIAGDGWSMGVLIRDLAAAYAARRAGRAPGWAPLPVQYADFALWQRAELGTEDDPDSVVSGQLAYWRAALAELPPELPLPADRPRPALASHRGGVVPVRVGAETHARLLDLAHESRTTVFMVVQAALAVVLSRLGAGEDIPIGTSVAGRGDAALDELVGFFLNTLVLRTDVSGDPAFTDILGRVRDTDLAAYSHQDIPFERLVDDLSPDRSMARHPLFQVMLILQNAPAEKGEWGLPGVSVRPAQAGGAPAAKFDLSVTLQERRAEDGSAAGLSGSVGFALDLFDRETAQMMATALVDVLDQVTADPSVPVSGVSVVGPDERSRMVEEWNDTAVPVPSASLAGLFEARVAENPEAIAIVSGDEEWSYASVNAAANRLAWHLADHGVGPEQRVALLLPRSPEMVIAVLAVVKTGAAYVPVDPDYPEARIAYTLADASPAIVVCTAETRGQASGPVVVLEDVTEGRSDDLGERARPDHPAYVIYTSGSTGKPKGVVVPHRNVVSLITAAGERFGLGRDDVWSLFHSYAFDFSVWEMWGALLLGGRLVVVPFETTRSPRDFLTLAADTGVTVLSQTPSAFYQLMQADQENPGTELSIRYVVFGGEALDPARLDGWYARHDAGVLVNMYGITETTVHVTHHGLDREKAAAGSSSVIGTPLDNTRVFVLDRFLQPVPAGVTGELYVAGTGLARGYLNRPGLTGERFVACPYGHGERMYRTGDLGRWTRDGNLVYAGRADAQVKIRGFRIEPAEIETALLGHDDVAQAAVIVREDQPGDRRLIGYIVAPNTDPADVRTYATGVLPQHMVPAALVPVDAIPLTPSGKLDKAALPAPDYAVTDRGPSTPAEETLCDLFGEVLGLDRVGVDDSFFALGGDSLLAMRLIARIRTVLDTDLPIRALFTAPTPAGVAAALGTHRTADDFDVLLPLRAKGDRPPVFCLHPVEGIGWRYAGLVEHLPPGHPVYALQARGLAGGEPRPDTMDEMVADYVRQLRTVQPAGPYHLLGWSLGGVIAHAVATHLQAQGEEVGMLAILDGYPSFRRPDAAEPAEGGEVVAHSGPAHDLDAQLEQMVRDVVELSRGADGRPRVTGDIATAIRDTLVNSRRIGGDHAPASFRGDVLLFVSTRGRPEAKPAELAPAEWAPYVDGRIESHFLDHAHGELTGPAAFGEIGRVLSAELRDPEGTDRA